MCRFSLIRLICLISLIVFTATLSGYFAATAFAESLSVSLRVGDTQISFDGYSSPGAYITIKQNGTVIGTTIADASGNWVKVIDAYNPGIQSYDLHATDTSSLLTPTISYNVNLPANTLTAISNIVFPPTLTAPILPTLSTDSLVLSGMTHPLSTLNILISDGTTYSVTPSGDGTWSISISMANSSGSYTAYATASMPGSYLSLASLPLSYTITIPPSTSPSSSTTPAPTSSTRSQSLYPGGTSTTKQKDSSNILTPPKQLDIGNVGTPIEYFYTIARNLGLLALLILLGFVTTVRAVYYFWKKRHKKSSSKEINS